MSFSFKIMKIAFIEPELSFKPFNAVGTYPLGILYNASTIKKAHPEYEVKCFDEDSKPVLKNRKVEPYILDSDFVGISAKTATAPRAYKIADMLMDLKARGETNPNQRIAIGGVHATALPNEAIEHADVVVRNEAENIIVPVVEEGLEGIIKGEKIQNLDSLPEPDYSLLDYKKRKLGDFLYGTLASISTSRGCSHHCDYCSVWSTFGNKLRIESPEKTFQKMKNLRERGFKRVFFHDDNFSDNKEYREALFDMLIKANLGIRYITQDRIDILQDSDYVEKMARSGCSTAMFSIECPTEEFLREHRKELDLSKIETGVELLKKNKINQYAFCMIDPKKPETVKQILGFLKYLKIKSAQFTIPTPLPGTVLYQKLKKEIFETWKHKPELWRYFDGLTLVTEKEYEKMKQAAGYLSQAWKGFYSPSKAIADIFLKFPPRIDDAIFRLYGWNIGRKIQKIQPEF